MISDGETVRRMDFGAGVGVAVGDAVGRMKIGASVPEDDRRRCGTRRG
jgi:hypothetical protein